MRTMSAARWRRPSPWRPWRCHIGAGEHGGVVDAVAHEGEVAAGGVEDALHLLDLVAGSSWAWYSSRPSFAATARATSSRSPVSITQAIDARGVQIADGLLGIVLHHIGDDDMTGIRAVDGDVQDGAGELAVMPVRAVGGHQLVVAHEHHVLIDGAWTPWPDSSAVCAMRVWSMSPL